MVLAGRDQVLQVDLGARQRGRLGASSGTPARAASTATWNTRDFDLQTSADGTTWTTRAQVRGNTADSTTTAVDVDARYVRLAVVTPAQDGNGAARIYEFEVRA